MKRICGLLIVIGTTISSCNIPVAGGLDPQIATAAALTVQAALTANPLAGPGDVGGAGEATPTYSKPMASVGEVTNCRTGPGTNYERIAQIFPSDPVEIVGFFPPNYWIVSTKFGECWLSGEFATPSGSFAGVSTVTAPPTVQGTAPQAPTFPLHAWTYFCYGTGQTDITITWHDNATNEAGYRVLRNGTVIAELPSDSTYFAETITLLSGQSVGYQIRAYNENGESNSTVATMTCP